MFLFSPQPFPPGNTPLGYPSNVQTQLFFQQPGLTHFDFLPLPSPYLPHQIPPPTPPSNHQNPNPLVTPPHLQHDTSYAPNSKYNSDVDFCTDTSYVENGKENPDEEKGTQKEHRHWWQHVKKRKREYTEVPNHVPKLTLTITPKTDLPRSSTDKKNETVHKSAPTEIHQISQDHLPYLYMESKTLKPCWTTLQT